MTAKKKTGQPGAPDRKTSGNNPTEKNIVDEEITAGQDNVTKEERNALSDAAKKSVTRDQQNLDAAKLDQFDEEGEPLNEGSGFGGDDLDVPGSELDDDNEEIGEEDEENNPYSVDEENEDKDINTRQ